MRRWCACSAHRKETAYTAYLEVGAAESVVSDLAAFYAKENSESASQSQLIAHAGSQPASSAAGAADDNGGAADEAEEVRPLSIGR